MGAWPQKGAGPQKGVVNKWGGYRVRVHRGGVATEGGVARMGVLNQLEGGVGTAVGVHRGGVATGGGVATEGAGPLKGRGHKWDQSQNGGGK